MNKMQLTQKIRIFPTEEQKEILWKLSEKCRLIYNFALKERREAFENSMDFIGYTKQQNDLPELKEKYPDYKQVYSKVLQHVLLTLDADYRSFFALRKKDDKTAQPPKYKGRRYFTLMTYNQSGFVSSKGRIRFSHKYNKIPLSFRIPDKFDFEKIYQVSIFMKDKEFYLSITYEKTEKNYVDNGLYQAFDLGVIKHTAVNMQGKFIEFRNAISDKYWNKRIKKTQSRRDHCRKNSRKWIMLNKNLKRMKRKSSYQLKDFQHKLSRKIIDNTKTNTIITGKLAVKQLCKINKHQKGLHTSLHNTGNINRLVGFLTYKAKLVGKRVIEINERGTTKMCCCCGRKHKMGLHKRIMICDCGNRLDRDKNSAVNILNRFLSQNAKWTGYQEFLGNLRQTGLPIQAMYPQEAPILKHEVFR